MRGECDTVESEKVCINYVIRCLHLGETKRQEIAINRVTAALVGSGDKIKSHHQMHFKKGLQDLLKSGMPAELMDAT